MIGYNDVNFSDTTGWYKDYVNLLAARKIINGTGNDAFSPNSSITRAQFAMILANLSGDDLSNYTASSFADVAASFWYSHAVQWAYEKGIVTGLNGKFNPDASISRQDIAVMLSRYAEKTEKYTLLKTNEKITFKDSSSIASYASDAVSFMQQAGIITGGSDGRLLPTADATRAQSAKMVAMMLMNIKK